MCKCIHGSILDELVDSVNLIITDPPIANLENYIHTKDLKNLSYHLDIDNYLVEFKKYLHKMTQVLASDGTIVLGHLGRSTSEYNEYQEPILYLNSLGFYLNEIVLIKLKNNNESKKWHVFSQHRPKNINTLTLMHADKRIKKIPISLSHLGVNDENNIKFMIQRYSLPGDTVLDPFGGSGTVACVAKAMSRVGLSFDIDIEAHLFAESMLNSEEYIQIIKDLPIKDFSKNNDLTPPIILKDTVL
jgi:DNA modification methylase